MAPDLSMTEAITSTATEVTKATIMVFTEAEYPAKNMTTA